MKLIYVSGPYSSPHPWVQQENIKKGVEVARLISTLPGLFAHSPHAATANWDGPDIPYEKFLEADLLILARMDAIVMMSRWTDSKGARVEHAEALRLGKPVFYWPLDRPALMRWAAGEADYALGAFLPAQGQPEPLTVLEVTDKDWVPKRYMP